MTQFLIYGMPVDNFSKLIPALVTAVAVCYNEYIFMNVYVFVVQKCVTVTTVYKQLLWQLMT